VRSNRFFHAEEEEQQQEEEEGELGFVPPFSLFLPPPQIRIAVNSYVDVPDLSIFIRKGGNILSIQ
jgi:hypothetical protein